MISNTLLKKEFKSNYKILLIFIAVLTMYEVIIVSMFNPELGETLDAFAKAMPEIMSAFGMANTGSTLTEFLSNYLYGFLLLVFPMILEIILANKLVAKYVDTGSMAYLLSTPNSRKKIVITQGLFVIINIVLSVRLPQQCRGRRQCQRGNLRNLGLGNVARSASRHCRQ